MNRGLMASSSARTFTSLKKMSREERIQILRKHFETKGYRVHSGLQFGCELVLYADDPDRVHSDFCVHLVDERMDWRTMQTLVRSMPDLHKTLVIAHIRETEEGESIVEELMIATEHAPFRQKKALKQVGEQRKKGRVATESNDKVRENGTV
jgi:tRNA-intron lyase